MASDGSIIIDVGLGIKKLASDMKGVLSKVVGFTKSFSSAFTGASNTSARAVEQLTNKLERQAEAVNKQSAGVQQLKEEYDRLISGEVEPKSVKRMTADLVKAEKEAAALDEKLQSIQNRAEIEKAVTGGISPETAAEMEDISQRLSEADAKADMLKRSLEQIRLDPSASADAKKLADDIQLGTSKLERLKSEATQTEDRLQGMQEGPENMAGAFGNAANQAKAAFNSINSGIKKILSGIGNVVKKMGQWGKSALTTAKNMLGLHNQTKKASSSTTSWAQKMTAALKRMIQYKIIRGILSGITSAAKEGIRNLARANSEFNASMSQLSTSTLYLKNSLGAALAPVLQAIIPIFSAVTDKVVELLNYIGMLFAKLSGATTYTKAVRYVQDYADSLDGATSSSKELTKSLAGFDTLQKLTFGSAAATIPDYSQMFEEVPLSDVITDPYELGKSLTERLTSAFDNIDWAAIKAKANEIAGNIANFLNGGIENTEFWASFGRTIGEGINTAVGFANTLLDKINWAGLGQSLAHWLNWIVETVDFIAIGELIANWWNAIFTTLGNFFDTFNWTNLGQKLADGLYTIVTKTDWQGIGSTIASGFNGVLTTIYTFLTAYDWSIIGSSFATGLNSIISGIDWGLLGATLGAGINTLFGLLYGFVTTFDWAGLGGDIVAAINNMFATIDWAQAGQAVSNAILGLFSLIREGLQGLDWEQIGTDIGTFLSNIDWAAIFEGFVGIIGDLISGVFTALKSAFAAMDEDTKKVITTIIALVAAFALLSIISSIISLVTSIGTAIAGLSAAAAALGVSLGALVGTIGLVVLAIAAVIAIIVLCIVYWDDIKEAASNAWEAIKSAAASVAGFFSNLWSSISNWFNKIIDGIKNVIEWIGNLFSAFGGSGGLGISVTSPGTSIFSSASARTASVPIVDVPALANGAVLPGNAPFLAVVNDQKHGTNVESPLSTIEEALDNVLDRRGITGGERQAAVFNLNGREFARASQEDTSFENRRRGGNLIVGTV